MKATIVYIIDPDTQEVLMAKKVRKVGIGYYFGYGGKIEGDESPEDCTCRETLKETGYVTKLKKENLERVALMRFFNGTHLDPLTDEPSFEVLCYRIFQKKIDLGIPKSTKEMIDPEWFKDIPFGTEKMKPGDELFVPQVISGHMIKGFIHFSDDGKTVLGSSISSCELKDLVI